MNKRFVAKYIPVYLFCIFALLAAVSFFLDLAADPIASGDIGLLYRNLFVPDGSLGSVGLSWTFFWQNISALPLAVYCLFCRVIPYVRSMICAAICLLLTLVPAIIQIASYYPLWGTVASWPNFYITILSVIALLFIVIDLTLMSRSTDREDIPAALYRRAASASSTKKIGFVLIVISVLSWLLMCILVFDMVPNYLNYPPQTGLAFEPQYVVLTIVDNPAFQNCLSCAVLIFEGVALFLEKDRASKVLLPISFFLVLLSVSRTFYAYVSYSPFLIMFYPMTIVSIVMLIVAAWMLFKKKKVSDPSLDG